MTAALVTACVICILLAVSLELIALAFYSLYFIYLVHCWRVIVGLPYCFYAVFFLCEFYRCIVSSLLFVKVLRASCKSLPLPKRSCRRRSTGTAPLCWNCCAVFPREYIGFVFPRPEPNSKKFKNNSPCQFGIKKTNKIFITTLSCPSIRFLPTF